MQLKRLIHSGKARSLGSALAAFIGYGGWAYYANLAHPFPASLKALLTQGSYSFVLTLSMSWIMEWLYRRIGSESARFPVTVILTCLLLYTTSWGINAFMGTPEILMTILPGAVIGTLYTLSYCLALSKFQSRNPAG